MEEADERPDRPGSAHQVKRTIRAIALAFIPLVASACGGADVTARFPAVTVLADTETGTQPLSVTFSITTTDPDGTIVRTTADLDGDGVFESDVTGLASVTHIYASGGFFTVTFKTEDDEDNTATATVDIIVASPGDTVRTLPYPAGTVRVADVVFDPATASLWLLAYDGAGAASLIRVDRTDGTVLTRVGLTDPRFLLAPLGEIAFDGTYFWITAGAPVYSIFKVGPSGSIVRVLSCPSTNTGVCRGLAFDGTDLWTGASDRRTVTRFLTNGVIVSTVTSPDAVDEVDDVGFDPDAGDLFIVTPLGNLYRLDPETGDVRDTVPVGAFTTGGWDGQVFWFVNDSGLRLEGVFTG